MNPEDFQIEDLFFSSHLYNVSWTEIFKEAAPMLPLDRKDFIISVAGSSTISPVIILSSLIIDNKIDKSRSDTTFRQEVKTFAEEILTQYVELNDDANSNIGTLSLLKVFDGDYAKLQRFLSVYTSLKKEIDAKDGGHDAYNGESIKHKSKRGKQQWQQPEESLILPYPMGECWNIGIYLFAINHRGIDLFNSVVSFI